MSVPATCPVCTEPWPIDATRCRCGYDFETRDPSVAIRRLRSKVREGNRLWWTGLFTMMALPIAIFLMPVPWNAVIAMAQGALAVSAIVRGLVVADRANQQLASARQLTLLPAARIVER